jgi:hypothetical protein
MDEAEAARLRRRRDEEERWLARQMRTAERRRARRFAVITSADLAHEGYDRVDAGRALTPSRSLVHHGEIPPDWVRPLASLPPAIVSEQPDEAEDE